MKLEDSCDFYMGASIEASGSSTNSRFTGSSRTKHLCHCKVESPLVTCRKTGPNYGKMFWGCGLYKVYGFKMCDFFIWLDEDRTEEGFTKLVSQVRELCKKDQDSQNDIMQLKSKLDELKKKNEVLKRKNEEKKASMVELKKTSTEMKIKNQFFLV